MILYDIFVLPQTALLALLSAVGVVGLGWSGTLVLTVPVLLALTLVAYMVLATTWTEVLDGARKELAVQLPLLLIFLLVVQSPALDVPRLLIVFYCASALSQAYGTLQTFQIEWIFPYRLRVNKNDRRPISTQGNINFMGAYVLPSFWLGLYLAYSVHWLFLLGVVQTVYLLVRMKCRGAWFGLASSVYAFLLLLSIDGFTGKASWLYLVYVLAVGAVIIAAVVFWLWKNWERINKERVAGSYYATPDENRYSPDTLVVKRKTVVSTLRYRICYWRCALWLFKKQPWRGHGLRSYRKLVYWAQAAINEREPDFLEPERYVTPQPRECHNDALEDLVELGVVGAAIKWLLVASMFYYADYSSVLVVCLLAGMVSVAGHGVFFFALRMPASGMAFWLFGGLVLLVSGVPAQTLAFPAWFALPLAAFAAVWLWEAVAKDVVGSWYFMRFAAVRDPVRKEHYCTRAIHWCPKETIYNTHALIGYLNVVPQHAVKYAEQMWHNYDGMTPGWVMHYNMAVVSEQIGNKEQAFRHYATSYRLLPTFADTARRLAYLEPYMPLPAKGEIVKKVNEEQRLRLLLSKSQADNLELQRQNAMAQVQNLVLMESNRLNIPTGWQYVFDEGVFLSPDEAVARGMRPDAHPAQQSDQSGDAEGGAARVEEKKGE